MGRVASPGRTEVGLAGAVASSNWINLGGPITGTGAAVSRTDSVISAPQRFYRLVPSP